MSKVSHSQSVGCAFCGEPWGNGVSKTKEHVLPQWLRDLVGRLPQQQRSAAIGIHLNATADGYVEMPFVTADQNSSIMNAFTREVCGTCKGGWMSRLEVEVRPVIQRLHRSAQTEEPIVLDAKDATVLARWIQKTALAHETGKDWHFGGPQERRLIMEGAPLRRSLVWLGRHADYTGVATAKALIGISDNRIPTVDDQTANASFFALSLQNLGIAVYLRPDRRSEAPPMPVQEWARVWPLPKTMEFPPIAPIDRDSLNRLFGNRRTWLPPLAVSVVERRVADPKTLRRKPRWT